MFISACFQVSELMESKVRAHMDVCDKLKAQHDEEMAELKAEIEDTRKQAIFTHLCA